MLWSQSFILLIMTILQCTHVEIIKKNISMKDTYNYNITKNNYHFGCHNNLENLNIKYILFCNYNTLKTHRASQYLRKHTMNGSKIKIARRI